jgi:hypothetical protein
MAVLVPVRDPVEIHADLVATQRVELIVHKLVEQLAKAEVMVNKLFLVHTGIILT